MIVNTLFQVGKKISRSRHTKAAKLGFSNPLDGLNVSRSEKFNDVGNNYTRLVCAMLYFVVEFVVSDGL